MLNPVLWSDPTRFVFRVFQCPYAESMPATYLGERAHMGKDSTTDIFEAVPGHRLNSRILFNRLFIGSLWNFSLFALLNIPAALTT